MGHRVGTKSPLINLLNSHYKHTAAAYCSFRVAAPEELRNMQMIAWDPLIGTLYIIYNIYIHIYIIPIYVVLLVRRRSAVRLFKLNE